MAGEIDLKVSADIGDLRRQLESIPGITAEQARLMVAELDRGYKRAEKAAASAAKATRASMKQAEEATKRAAQAGKELGDQFGNVGSGAGKLAGALDMLLPGLGSVGQGVADLADVGEVAAGALGGAAAPALAVVATAAAGAAIYMTALANEMAREAESARIAGTANAYVAEQLQIQRVAALDLAVATGQLSEAARAEADIRMQAGTSLERYLNTLEDTSKASLETENRNVAIAETLGMIGTAAVAPVAAFVALANAMGANIPTVTDLTKKLGEYMGFIGVYPKTQQDVARATEAATAATKKARDGQLEVTKAKRQHVEATKDLRAELEKSAADKEAEAAAAQLQKDAAELNANVERIMGEELARTSTEAEKLTYRLFELQEQTESLAKANVNIDTTRAQEVLIAQIAAAEEAARVKAADDAKKAQEAQLAADIEFYTRRAEIANGAADVVSAYSQYKLDQQVTAYEDAVAAQEALGKNATEGEKKRAAEETQEKRRQAMIAFAIDKAAKLAQALTAAALATINALATPPAPNYIAAGLAAAGGAVQVATIAATRPSFHSGGMADFAPDEASAIVRRGEAVLSPAGRAAIGDDTIRAANAGMGSGQTIVVQQVYRHRVFDSFVTDNLRTRGPLSRALGAGARAGQRRS
jgi:hypothetical protein